MLTLSLGLASFGCDLEAPTPGEAGPAMDAPSADVAGTTIAEERRGYEIPIPQIEYWDDARTILKFTYEMRFDPVSVRYGEFGDFYIGMQMPLDEIFKRLCL